MKQFGLAAGLIFILFLLSLHSGYVIGTHSDNMSEIESELSEVNNTYQETKEDNLSIQETDLEDMSKLETGYYKAVVRPVYEFGQFLLDMSENTIRVSARFSYRYL